MSRARAELDDQAQQDIFLTLENELDRVEMEKVRLIGHGELSVCVVVPLSDSFQIRCSVNQGTILVSVGDGTIQLHRNEWRRSESNVAKAKGWISGYHAGWMQGE